MDQYSDCLVAVRAVAYHESIRYDSVPKNQLNVEQSSIQGRTPHQFTPFGPKESVAWFAPLFGSTVGAKFLVAITGLALTGFVIVHMLGNLQIFLGREAINEYAHKLKSLGPLLWVARLSLLAIFVIHIWLAIRLKLRSAGPANRLCV